MSLLYTVQCTICVKKLTMLRQTKLKFQNQNQNHSHEISRSSDSTLDSREQLAIFGESIPLFVVRAILERT